MTPACAPHDWYYRAKPLPPHTYDSWKIEADEVFRNNLIRLTLYQHNEEKDPQWLLVYRLRLCQVYYNKVHQYGGPAFWANKNLPAELKYVWA